MAMIREVYRHLFKKRATVLYPFKEREKVHLPTDFRGKLAFYRERCIGCGLCFRVCPSETIEMITDEKGKRPIFYLDRCTFCAQCEEICPVDAIEMTTDFEFVGFDRKETLLK